MKDLSHLIKSNPLYNVLASVHVNSVEQNKGLERTYFLDKSNKVLKILKALPGTSNDLSKLDHNKLLDLYPDYEYIFGPFVDANVDEFALVYLLYTNRINSPNEIKVLYAGHVIEEHDAGKLLSLTDRMRDMDWYSREISARELIKGKLNNHCYYRQYLFGKEERELILELYLGRSVSQPRYNTLRENFIMTITTNEGVHVQANPYRILYEVHHAKRRLTDKEVVSSVNGRKADLRFDNTMVRNLQTEDSEMRQSAWDLYGLDTYALEKIYATIGYNRFRGLYCYGDKIPVEGHRERKYVKLVKGGTDIQCTIYLSRALMTVKENRVLTEHETVDHINHDKTNDKMDNLRLINRSTHIAQDSVRVEIDPVQCCICNKTFHLSSKAFYYYKNYPSPITCTPRCKKKLRVLDKSARDALVNPQAITYRYYVLDKVTKKPRYFDSQDYRECKRLLTTETRFHRTEE